MTEQYGAEPPEDASKSQDAPVEPPESLEEGVPFGAELLHDLPGDVAVGSLACAATPESGITDDEDVPIISLDMPTGTFTAMPDLGWDGDDAK